MSPNPLTAPSSGPRHLDFTAGEGVDHVAAGIGFVRKALASWHIGTGSLAGDEERALDVVLVAAELIGNAERHGGGTRSVDVEHGRGRLRITVCDENPWPPRPAVPHRPERVGGHGLHIVGLLACDWGWRPDGSGKAVWAELEVPAPGEG